MDGELTQVDVERAAEAAIKEARNKRCQVNVAIVDKAGFLKLFKSMDDAKLSSIDIAIRKARTAALTQVATSELRTRTGPEGDLRGIELSNGGLITIAGGLPIERKTHIIGAIGVSGASVEVDEEIAEAGRSAFGGSPD